MSYDVRLKSASDAPASDQQVNDALAVLARYDAHPFERSNGFSVRWDDGTGFTMYTDSLGQRPVFFSALLSPLGNLSQRFCNFTHEFACAIDCAIYINALPPLTIVVRSAMIARLPESMTKGSKVVQASSGSAVHNALTESYSAWRGLVRDTVQRLNESIRGRE